MTFYEKAKVELEISGEFYFNHTQASILQSASWAIRNNYGIVIYTGGLSARIMNKPILLCREN